ncbi:MAG TPA: AAA family ATPase [Nocardioides sp.]|nr:AAA family ATPase [Nocardioides sp.]
METDAGAVCGVLVLSGPPCSGKSTVGRVLAAGASSSRPRRLHIEVDSLFDLLLPRSDRNRDDRMLAYDSAHLLARMFLERGTTAVLECTYARIEQRLSLVDALAGVPAAPLWVVECFVSPEEAVRRFRRRSDATDLDESLLRERVQGFRYSEQALRLISSRSTPEALAEQVTSWMHPSTAVQRRVWAESGRGWS